MSEFDSLVSEKQFVAEIGFCGLTIRRRDADPPPGWPSLVLQNGRRFRWRSEIETYKTVTAALGERTTNLPPPRRRKIKAAVDVTATRIV